MINNILTIFVIYIRYNPVFDSCRSRKSQKMPILCTFWLSL